MKPRAPRCRHCKRPDTLVEYEHEGYTICTHCNYIAGTLLDASEGAESFISSRADISSDLTLRPDFLSSSSASSPTLDATTEADLRLQKQKLVKLGNALGLRQPVVDRAASFYFAYGDYLKRRGDKALRGKGEILAACLLEAAAQSQVAVSLPELLRGMRVPEKEARRVAGNITRVRHKVQDVVGGGGGRGEDAVQKGVERIEIGDPTREGFENQSFSSPVVTLEQRYREMMQRCVQRLCVPGVYTIALVARLGALLEDKLPAARHPEVVLAYVVYTILTSQDYLSLCGTRVEFVIPLGSPGERILRAKLSDHFGVRWADVEAFGGKVTEDVRQGMMYEAERYARELRKPQETKRE